MISAKETYNFKEPTHRSHPIVPQHPLNAEGLLLVCDMTYSHTSHAFNAFDACIYMYIHKSIKL